MIVLKNFFNKNIFLILSVVVISFAIYQAYFFRWLCDDAFISFVYSRNLAEGAGLVFQLGERVEGYSNFLWTVLLSIGIKLSVSPLDESVLMGIFSFLGLLIYFCFQEKRIHAGYWIPVFTIHLSLFYHHWIFATSGLETMCFTLFLSMALSGWEKKSEYTSSLLAVLSLIRPEGVLFFGIHFCEVFFKFGSTGNWKRIFSVKYLLPLFVLLGFELARIYYYGEILPNTFYAKADHPGYFGQGINYLMYWFRSYPVYIGFFFYGLYLFTKDLLFDSNKRFLSFAVVLYIIYVIYVGGDFMGMRFWIPIIPYFSWIVYVRLSAHLNQIIFTGNTDQAAIKRKKIFFSFVLFLFIFSLAVYINPFGKNHSGLPTWRGIGEERRFYENKLISDAGYDKNSLEGFRVAFFGAQAHFIYWMQPYYAWEAETGLTDKRLARKSTSTRGRVGHEKNASLAELKERNLDLVLDDRFPLASLPHIFYRWRNFSWKIMVVRFNSFKFSNLCKRKDWDCSPLYKEIARKKMDTSKEIDFLQ
ncbi:hypothetical protein [Leptospira sp. 'Mane']|uniref:hypothetical protein n=1 Tax=Leptospira sp. 'Mane' TaxID=3387407 RepID=UPI00398AED7F